MHTNTCKYHYHPLPISSTPFMTPPKLSLVNPIFAVFHEIPAISGDAVRDD